MGHGFCQQWKPIGDQWVKFELSLAYHCSNMETPIFRPDIIQLSHPVEIDQYARLNHAEIHGRHKALSARQ